MKLFTKKTQPEVDTSNFTEHDWEMLDAIMLFMKFAILTSPPLAAILMEPCFLLSKLYTRSGRDLPKGDVRRENDVPSGLDNLSELTKGRI